jgi:hypothetical protein
VLGYYTIGELLLFLLPLTAAAWSACLLIYARLIGRVAWVVSVVDRPTKTGRKKSRKRARRPQAE